MPDDDTRDERREPPAQPPTEAWSAEDFWAAREDEGDADPFWSDIAEEKQRATDEHVDDDATQLWPAARRATPPPPPDWEALERARGATPPAGAPPAVPPPAPPSPPAPIVPPVSAEPTVAEPTHTEPAAETPPAAAPWSGDVTEHPADEPPSWATAGAESGEGSSPVPLEGSPAPAAEPAEYAITRGFTPTTLSRKRAATLGAFTDALIPPGGPIPYAAADVGVAERVDASLSTWHPRARRNFMRTLGWFEWSSLFSRHLRPFSRLGVSAQSAYLEHAQRSKFLPRRAAFDLLKFYCLNQWASTAPVEQAIGFTYGCVTNDPPRDGDRLEVLSYPQVSRDHVEECDVVVVGSGAGGAVIAKELAELGLSVIVIEEGAYYTRQDFTGPPFERLLKMYRRQGMTAALGSPSIPLPMGMAVGGTTVINSGSCFRTPDRVLSRWESESELPGVDPTSMKPFFDRVERIQRVQPVPEELLGENARIFRRGADALGLHGEPMRRNIDGCRGCGVCAFGCPSDAKLGTHLTYLPRAQRAGATIYGNARAHRILIEGGRAHGVVASLLDPRTREPQATLTVRSKIVVVAAGAIHTPVLLMRNALGNRSGQLGKHLRIHPAAAVGAFFDEPVYGWRGTLQPFYVDDWHESHDIMIEVTSSVPSVGAGTFPGSGARLKEMLGRYPFLASAGLFVSDTSAGRVRHASGDEPLVTYKLNDIDTRKIVRGLARTAEIFLAAGARAVMTGIPGVGAIQSTRELENLKEEAIKPGGLRLTAFHPVGTARMGADPGTSVVDPWGEVHGVPGLFVTDASMLPGCPTVNPQITIMAFATRTIDHLARESARYF